MGLYLRAQAWLEAVVAAVEDPPERQLVAEGEIARDCQQIAVRLNRAFHGLPGLEGTTFRASGQPLIKVVTAEFIIEVTRCAAPGQSQANPIPTPEAIGATAETMMADLDALLRINSSDLGTGCAGLYSVVGQIVGPEGGFVTAQLIAQEQMQ